MALTLAYAAARHTALAAGARRSSLPGFTDPADAFADADTAPARAAPADRAAQIQAFIAATGGERGG